MLKFNSVGSMITIAKKRSGFVLLFVLFLASLAYAGDLKDKVHIVYSYSNENCKTFKVVSEADAPVWLRIQFVYYKDDRDDKFIKIYVEPGEVVCCQYPRGWEEEYSKPFIVAVWYAK